MQTAEIIAITVLITASLAAIIGWAIVFQETHIANGKVTAGDKTYQASGIRLGNGFVTFRNHIGQKVTICGPAMIEEGETATVNGVTVTVTRKD